MGSLVDTVLDRIGIRDRVDRAATAARWDEVAGPEIARRTRARGCRGGTLFVEVAGAAWMTELDMMRRTLLERLNEGRERGRIERLVFVQSDDGSTITPRRGRPTRGRG
ncbi:MAG: DUF721 domain-containing protein [Gemmatimonadota bacterium]|nr:DUF721 domain-containing protein [Gemmatimonadota bacterium]